MSNHLATLFAQSARLHDNENSWLQDIVTKEIAAALSAQPPFSNHDCLLADIGTFLVQATNILAEIAKGVADGPHIDIYTTGRIDQMKNDSGFSELDPLITLDQRHESLRYVIDHT